ncbi:MAG TPA: AAA family ATPase [Umezawaea sp.]|nr:AAA family ATPase [Umezawaea sp.]
MRLFPKLKPERPDLVEREQDLSAALAVIMGRRPDKGGILVVEGTVGSGKTSLLRQIVNHVSDEDTLVVSATCSRFEQDQQYASVREMLLLLGPAEVSSAESRRRSDDLLVAMSDKPGANAATIHEEFFAVLHEAAGRRRLVIVVDDAQHVDFSSARCLLHAARRFRASGVSVVVARSTVAPPRQPFFHHELFRQPNCRTIRLDPLTERGVGSVLGGEVDAAAAHRATAGNPLLVQAVREDSWAGDQPVFGDEFASAVLGALHRTSDELVRLARGVAVLGPISSPMLLAKLFDVEPTHVTLALDGLTGAGLVRADRFRHPRARAAVLDEMPPGLRSELHLRTAELLHDDGAAVRTVAEHLIAAGATRHPWAVDVLHQAARQAVTSGDAPFAERCLDLASWSSQDEQQHATSKVLLLELAWRTDPATSERHVACLVDALRLGKLGEDHILSLIRHLLWHGRVSEAAEALLQLGTSGSSGVRALRLSLTHTFPALAALMPVSPDESVLDSIDPQVRAAKGLADLLTNSAGRTAVSEAKHVLRSCPPDELTFETARLALLTLVYADELGEAALRCDRLMDAETHDHVPTWRAMLRAIRAEAALRSGDLTTAEHYARTALADLPAAGWGVAIAFPLSCLLLALLALGKLDEAAELVDTRIPVTLLQSRHGLSYLHARGQYHLATGAPQAALDDFRHCGELMRSWKLEMPTLAPWRSGAAEALMKLGEHDEARALLREQLDLVSTDYPRTRGATLRMLAATEGPQERRTLLTEAVELLSGCGDRLELARAMLDLGNAHGALGEPRRARVQTQMAHSVAKQCGATPLATLLPVDVEPVTEQTSALTHAERRVAVLAARGHTNREIAQQLFVTPSTVEQHLTKVFRKLGIRSRAELPQALASTAGGAT